MITFDFILQGHEATERNARDCINGLDWSEIPTREAQRPTHSRYIDSAQGIGIYYDYAADYFFFADEEPDQ